MGNGADEDIRQMNEIVSRARAVDERGHGLCPWCGGRARMEVLPSESGALLAAPCCTVCGLEPPTALPIMGTLEGLSEECIEHIVAPAWEAWDRARWRGGR